MTKASLTGTFPLPSPSAVAMEEPWVVRKDTLADDPSFFSHCGKMELN